MNIQEKQDRVRELHISMGARFDSLEKHKIYFFHEFTNGKKTAVYLVQFQGYNEHGDADFIKKDYEGKHDFTWIKGENPYLCNVWKSAPNMEHSQIIGDR